MSQPPVILVGDSGKEFVRPVPPQPGADIETKIAYLRACHAWKDSIADHCNREFDKAFRAELEARW